MDAPEEIMYYFKDIELENVGPIDLLKVEFGFNQDDTPKPMILVGENGSGKSIFLSYLVNCLLLSKQALFNNTEIEKGKVYKIRSPLYIKHGRNYYHSSVNFTPHIPFEEWQLSQTKRELGDKLKDTPEAKIWPMLGEDDIEKLDNSYLKDMDAIKLLINKQCCLFFSSQQI